jgi:hypothetical protein
MAPLILRVLLSCVVTLLTCTPCFVQGLNNIFMVSLFMHIIRRHVALVMCASMFYVQNCWTNFDEGFYDR